MDVDRLCDRVRLRLLDDEEQPSDAVIGEMLRSVIDRMCIRMETGGELPAAADSIAVDAAVKALRLRGFEGSVSESAAEGGSMSSSFVDDVLSAYAEDLAALKRTMRRGGIKFFR